ncbi:MAG: hypothetical protein K6347_07715 [Campylobacterales bacterium]
MLEEDRFIRQLEEATLKLKSCQQEKFPEANPPSCLPCPQLLECTIRLTYVDAVYKSMNKGQHGGFEF